MRGSSHDDGLVSAAEKPVQVGGTRQLFVDDALIAATNLQRTFHRPALHPASPVLVPETPLEINGGVMPAAAMASVFYDAKERLFKMWYLAGYDDATVYAYSTDGLDWVRPMLDVEHGTNRVLAALPGYVRNGATVWLDEECPLLDERYKMFVFYRAGTGGWPRSAPEPPPDPQELACLYTSADGIAWRMRTRTGPCGDNTSFYRDPLRGLWCFSIRTFGGSEGRKRSTVAVRDFIEGSQWRSEDVRPWLQTDARDRPDAALQWRPELYKVDCAPYESIMVGLLGIYLGPPNHIAGPSGTPKTIDLQIAFSRNGVEWQRPDRTPFLACSREEGTWNRGYLQASGGVCVSVGDELWFYFSAFSGLSPAQGLGPYAGGSLGLATLRRDGFASMDGPGLPMPAVDRHGARAVHGGRPAHRSGFLMTVPVALCGETLFVNAVVRADALRVEVLDAGGVPIQGFGADECIPVTGDSTAHAVRWRQAGCAALQGRSVRLRFWMDAGELYSFWTG